ncbi:MULTISPECIES: exodeoxyribonuclease V subunit alpha [unclassified Oceanobacter]|uniref:exodeoxyribonuclease V subunit alpha n=1 Tax=unclassified Oceanobacter TaxID=2620260 RepID=UPI0027366DC1|nr:MULTISPECIES: exodeoxyribonuclease V subunit alpha [unclassified Oceanobacter]MDP2609620.1 exodeoxyribonuclease V subunit alpha [Oceanobacter sp. 1_MG-2023]MDP2612703.1 exodeoxyribonuclease V subunit alpha [Oceanobacter sp. 2_MG-2023]
MSTVMYEAPAGHQPWLAPLPVLTVATPLSPLLDRLVRTERLREIDHQLSRQLLAYEGECVPVQAQALYLASALVSIVLGRGQVCLPLHYAPLPELAANWPAAAQWHDWLRGCSGCWWSCYGDDSDADGDYQGQPLVLEQRWVDGQPVLRLYLARYFFYQRGLEQQIRERLALSETTTLQPDVLRPALATLFSPRHDGQNDWQAIAATTACLQHFSVITGGPGTGKTTTVTRLLSALLTTQPHLRIALAAPTGKAAARMTESIRGAKSQGGIAMAEWIPDISFTLHRLLGWHPGGFRYGPERHLPYDCVVVDESSMIDLAMMYQLISALAPMARLILLGDKDQLASVEAGSVLADLCDAGVEHWPEVSFGQQVAALCGYNPAAGGPGVTASASGEATNGMVNAVVSLKVSHRFDANSGIGQLAAATNRGDVAAALAVFPRYADIDLLLHDSEDLPAAAPAYQGIETAPGQASWQQVLVDGYRSYCDAVASADSVHMLAALNDFQVLVATRQGPFGVESMNLRIEELLTRAGLLRRSADSLWYSGRPVMVTRNDYDLGLFNGDIGVTVTDAAGALRVAFQTADGGVRYLLPSRLPSHETSFAMTVHKSQGSEFVAVQLLLPPLWQPVITRELVYTAITRARERFVLLTSHGCWRQGLASRVERASGLRDALWS